MLAIAQAWIIMVGVNGFGLPVVMKQEGLVMMLIEHHLIVQLMHLVRTKLYSVKAAIVIMVIAVHFLEVHRQQDWVLATCPDRRIMMVVEEISPTEDHKPVYVLSIVRIQCV